MSGGRAGSSWTNASRSSRRSPSSSGGGGTKVAVSIVAPGAPIQFCDVRNSLAAGAASNPVEDDAVHVADQACAERQRGKSWEPCLDGADVVDDFLDIGPERLVGGLGVIDVGEARLGSFDAGRRNRFSSEVRADEKLWVGEQSPSAGQAAQSSFRVGHLGDCAVRKIERSRNGVREERDVSMAPTRSTAGTEGRGVVALGVHLASPPLSLKKRP